VDLGVLESEKGSVGEREGEGREREREREKEWRKGE
jgi:hypothetical protein